MDSVGLPLIASDSIRYGLVSTHTHSHAHMSSHTRSDLVPKHTSTPASSSSTLLYGLNGHQPCVASREGGVHRRVPYSLHSRQYRHTLHQLSQRRQLINLSHRNKSTNVLPKLLLCIYISLYWTYLIIGVAPRKTKTDLIYFENCPQKVDNLKGFVYNVNLTITTEPE